MLLPTASVRNLSQHLLPQLCITPRSSTPTPPAAKQCNSHRQHIVLHRAPGMDLTDLVWPCGIAMHRHVIGDTPPCPDTCNQYN